MNDGCNLERCAECSYSAYSVTLGVHCQYILIEGKARGCEPGAACDKFTTGPVKRDEEQWASDLMPKNKKGDSGEGIPLPG